MLWTLDQTQESKALRKVLRRLPVSRRDAEQRLILMSGFGLAVLAHIGVLIVVASLPDKEPVASADSFVEPLSVEVVYQQRTEDAEEPDVAVVPEPVVPEPVVPEPVVPEPVEVAEVKLAAAKKPPEVVKKPEPAVKPPEPRVAAKKPKKKVRKKRIRYAKKKTRAAKKPAAAAAPKLVTKIIASPSEGAPSGPVAVGPTNGGEPDGTPGVEPGGDPKGDQESTSETGTPDGELNAPEVDLAALRRGYISKVTRAVHRRHRYPRAAARAGLEGRVLVELTIDATGKIIQKRVIESSGHAVLDRAALAAIGSVGSLPTPPSELRWTRQSMRVPFVYGLSPRG
ncbi:MAG: protein TonB [Myxococcota bacterium]|jgi:protein TonB